MSARSLVGNVIGNGLSEDFRYPNASVGLFPGEETGLSKLPSNLQNPFPQGGAMDFFDGEARNFNTGVSISNFSSINHSLVHSFTTRFPKDTIRSEMVVFVERSSKSPLLHFPNCTSEVASVHELNRYLVTAEGRALYGRERSCEKLVRDFGFMGSYNLNIPDYVVDSFNGGVVTGRRARITDITRAQMDKGASCASPTLAVVHLIAVHRTLKDQTGLVSQAPVTAVTARSHVLASRASANTDPVEMPKHDYGYWTLHPHTAQTNSAPAPWLYNDDVYSGFPFRIGFILQHSGEPRANEVTTNRTRLAMSGVHNCLEKDRDYLNIADKLPYLDVCMGL